MEEMKSNAGMWGWNGFNTLLASAGTALGATALGVKANASHFNKCGDYWGNYNGGCGCEPLVNRYELHQSQRISELESGRETDTKILDVYKALASENEKAEMKFNQLTKSLTDYIIANNRETDARFAKVECDAKVNTQAINDNLRFLDYKIDNNQKEMFAYVDCRTLPLEKKIGLNQICPQPLPACVPVAVKGQVIDSVPVDATNTQVGERRMASK